MKKQLKWSEMSVNQKSAKVKKINDFIRSFEKENNVSFDEILDDSQILKGKIFDACDQIATKMVMQEKAINDFEIPTPSKVFNDSLKSLLSLNIPGQNEVIANLFSTIKAERVKNVESMNEKMKTISQNHKNAMDALQALTEISGGGMDRLMFR